MPNINDKLLIKWYIDFAIDNDWNLTRMGKEAKMTRSWASLLVKGKIGRLHFDTRNRIMRVMGILQ